MPGPCIGGGSKSLTGRPGKTFFQNGTWKTVWRDGGRPPRDQKGLLGAAISHLDQCDVSLQKINEAGVWQAPWIYDAVNRKFFCAYECDSFFFLIFAEAYFSLSKRKCVVTLWTSQPLDIGPWEKNKNICMTNCPDHLTQTWCSCTWIVGGGQGISWISWDVPGMYHILTMLCPQGVILTSSTRRSHTQTW